MKDQILTASFNIYHSLFNADCEPVNDQTAAHKRWKNPDNWSYGSLGSLFFALELYCQTKDPMVWAGMMERLEQIERAIGTRKSVNYSLYFGKTGLAHFYIKLFRVSAGKEFAARALDLVKDCFDPEWWPPAFEKSSMAEGISGFLLFSISFYQATGMAEMAGVAQRLLSALLEQAQLADNGVFWRGNGPNGRCWSGITYGGSGIALALLQMGMATGNDQLLNIGPLAMRFECSNNTEETDAFPRLGLYHGEAGKQLVSLYYNRLHGDTQAQHGWRRMVETMSRLLHGANRMHSELGMSNGIAGWGISLLDGARITGMQEARELADQIGSSLLRHIDAVRTAPSKDVSFSTGLPGIGYFLLRLNCADRTAHLPFLMDISPGQMPGYKPRPSVPYCQALLLKSMPGTCRLLGELYPAAANSLLSAAHVLPEDVIVQMRGLITGSSAGEREKELLSIAEKEYFGARMQKWAIMRVHAGDEEFKSGVARLFATPEKNIMDLRLSVSSHIRILDLDERPNFLAGGKFTKEDLNYLLTQYGAGTFWYIADRYGSVEAQLLGIGKLYCFLFAEEKTVREAFHQLVSLVNRQQKETAGLLARALGGDDASNINKLLKSMMIGAIPTLVVAGVLRVH